METNRSGRLFNQTIVNTKSNYPNQNYACCISLCKNYNNTSPIELFPLPTNLEERKLWCTVLGIPNHVSFQPNAKVCSLHFRSKVCKKPSQFPPSSTQYVVVEDRGSLIGTQQTQAPSREYIVDDAVFNLITSDSALPQESTVSVNDCSITNNPDTEEEMSTNATLSLECDEDVLSTAQLNAYMKELMAFISANELVHRLPPAVSIPKPTSPQTTISTTAAAAATTIPATQHFQPYPFSVPATPLNSVASMPNIVSLSLDSSSAVSETSPNCVTSLSSLPSIPSTTNGFVSTFSTFSNSFSTNNVVSNNNALYTTPSSVVVPLHPTAADSLFQPLPFSLQTTPLNSVASMPNIVSLGLDSSSAVSETSPNCVTSLSSLPSIPSTTNGFVSTISTFSNSFSTCNVIGNNNVLYTTPSSGVVPLHPAPVLPLHPAPALPLHPTPIPPLHPTPVPPLQLSHSSLPILQTVLSQQGSTSHTVASAVPLSSSTTAVTNKPSTVQPSHSLNRWLMPQTNNTVQCVPTVSVASTSVQGSSVPKYITIPLSTFSSQSSSVSGSGLNTVNSSASSALLSLVSSFGNSNYPLNNGPIVPMGNQYGTQIGRQPFSASTKQLQQLETISSQLEPCIMPQYNNSTLTHVNSNKTVVPMFLQEAGKRTNTVILPPTEEILPLRSKNDGLQPVGSCPNSSNQPSKPEINPNCDEVLQTENDLDATDLGLFNVATVYGTPPPSEVADDELEEAPVEPISIQNVFSSIGRKLPAPRINSVPTGQTAPHKETPRASASGHRNPFSGTVFNNSMGPVIVDVISAIDGANEYFDGDKIPEILLDKNRRNVDSPTVFLEETTSTAQVNSAQEKSQEFSIFSIQDEIPVLPGGLEKVDTKSYFDIKCPPPKNRNEDTDTLRMRLRKEKFIQCSVWWLIQRKYMPLNPPCCLCGHKIFTIDRNKKFYDGYCWTCSNRSCRSEEAIQRPTFFERFKFCSLEELLLLTFHWACQSTLDEILLDVNIDLGKICSYFRALQELCLQVSTKRGLLGTDIRSKVEVSVVKLGHYFIMGAMDRKSRYTRLEMLTKTEACHTSTPLRILENWLHKNALLICEKELKGNVLPGIPKYGRNPVAQDCRHPSFHTFNISKYLSKNLIGLFGRMHPFYLTPDDVKGFLYELQWRGKYGKFVDMAFWSILNHIRELNPKHVWQVVVRPGMLPGSEMSGEKMQENLISRWGPMSIAEKANSVKIPSSQIDLSPLFLASKSQKSYSRPSTFHPVVGNQRYNDSTSMSVLFQDIPEITGGTHNITSKALLAIKLCSEESKKYNMDALYLGVHLKTEGFIKNPVKWLVRKGYINSVAPCYVCNSPSFLRENLKSSDGCSWLCQNNECRFENVFKRPSFFARFQYPMAHIAAMIFHWTVQSDINIITSDAPMDSSKISHAWRSFQVLCSACLKRDTRCIGGPNQIVEVALVQFGKLYILGAMERGSRTTLLRVFPTEMHKQVDALYSTLSAWVEPNSILVINSTKNFSLGEQYNVVVADSLLTDTLSPNYHVLNVTSYLLTHISNMFGHLRSDMVRHELVQIYLDELMWRELYGKHPQQAFKRIMDEIFYNELQEKSLAKSNLATCDEEEKVTKRPEREEVPPEEISIICLKEARVVLRRIPQTVLKYYNCLPSDVSEKPSRVLRVHPPTASSKDDNLSDSSTTTSEEMSSDYEESSSESSSDEDAVTIIEEKKKKRPVTKWGLKHFVELQNKKTSSEAPTKLPLTVSLSDVSLSDISLDSMSSEKLTDSVTTAEIKDTPTCTQNSLPIVKSEKPDPLMTDNLEDASACIPNSLSIVKTEKTDLNTGTVSKNTASTSNAGNPKSVQPLVIKMHKKRRKIRSYLKSEFAKKHNFSNNVTIMHNSLALSNKRLKMKKELRTYQKGAISSPRISPKTNRTLNMESACAKSASDLVSPIEGVSVVSDLDAVGIRPGRRHPVTLKRVLEDTKSECIECGEFSTQDHYMKQFSCTDCKRSLYTTCCPNAFFEHRGSLLFGKRSRRAKTNSRLHRPVLQKSKWFCPCGFSTNQGNRLASHMVKCNEPTSYL